MQMAIGEEGVRVNLHQLLRAMIEKGASDMHVTTGSPPLLRIDGAIVPLKLPPLSPVETKQLCYSVLTEDQKIQFEKNKELDLSFGVKNLSRFRANILSPVPSAPFHSRSCRWRSWACRSWSASWLPSRAGSCW
jgi:Tfp pilus assembly pilus retraction ATPase PilT